MIACRKVKCQGAELRAWGKYTPLNDSHRKETLQTKPWHTNCPFLPYILEAVQHFFCIWISDSVIVLETLVVFGISYNFLKSFACLCKRKFVSDFSPLFCILKFSLKDLVAGQLEGLLMVSCGQIGNIVSLFRQRARVQIQRSGDSLKDILDTGSSWIPEDLCDHEEPKSSQFLLFVYLVTYGFKVKLHTWLFCLPSKT